MRYYKIVITDPDSGSTAPDESTADEIVVSASKPASRIWSTLLPNGTTDPAAPLVEVDAPVTAFDDPMGDTGAAVRIWGVAWQDTSSAADFNGKTLQFYGGMSKGLPLANPAQQGLLFQGRIYQAYGNWVGTGMALNFVVLADTGTSSDPSNISFSWKAGTKLSAAITSALDVAYPDLTVKINLSVDPVLTYNITGTYQTMVQFARWLRQMSQSLSTDTNYRGVRIVLSDGEFDVYDAATAADPIVISFQDLIGQPTWKDPFQIQAMVVMRADIHVGDVVTIPPGLQTIQPQGAGLVKNRTTFSGNFQINHVRHAGISRQADAAAWVTMLDMYQVPAT